MDEALDKIATRARWDLFFLAKYILGYDKMEPEVHQELCNYCESLYTVHPPEWVAPDEKRGKEMEDQFHYGNTNLMALMPRGSFKSSVITISFAAQWVLHNPNARVLIDSETIGKSKAFMRELKWHMEANPKYREVFKFIHGVYPDEGMKRKDRVWTDAMMELSCRTRRLKEPTFTCSGIDRAINGMHYDLIIADDLHSEKNVTNTEQIEQVIEHWKLCYSLLDPDCPMIVIGTRWDFSDLYQYILDEERDSFNIIIRKAIKDDGSLFFPQRLTLSFLNNQKKKQGSRIFSAQYQNEPVDDETATFKRSYFQKIDDQMALDRPTNWYLSVDPSYEGEYSDYAALVVAGMDYQRQLIVRHITRRKMTYAGIIQEMFRLYSLFHPKLCILESTTSQKSIMYELNNEMKSRNAWLPLKEVRGYRASKVERIRGLAPYYEFGHAWHMRGCPNLDQLEYELAHFPRGKNDDIIDALATVLEFANAPNPRNRDVEKDRRGHHKHLGYYKPRNPITGV